MPTSPMNNPVIEALLGAAAEFPAQQRKRTKDTYKVRRYSVTTDENNTSSLFVEGGDTGLSEPRLLAMMQHNYTPSGSHSYSPVMWSHDRTTHDPILFNKLAYSAAALNEPPGGIFPTHLQWLRTVMADGLLITSTAVGGGQFIHEAKPQTEVDWVTPLRAAIFAHETKRGPKGRGKGRKTRGQNPAQQSAAAVRAPTKRGVPYYSIILMPQTDLIYQRPVSVSTKIDRTTGTRFPQTMTRDEIVTLLDPYAPLPEDYRETPANLAVCHPDHPDNPFAGLSPADRLAMLEQEANHVVHDPQAVHATAPTYPDGSPNRDYNPLRDVLRHAARDVMRSKETALRFTDNPTTNGFGQYTWRRLHGLGHGSFWASEEMANYKQPAFYNLPSVVTPQYRGAISISIYTFKDETKVNYEREDVPDPHMIHIRLTPDEDFNFTFPVDPYYMAMDFVPSILRQTYDAHFQRYVLDDNVRPPVTHQQYLRLREPENVLRTQEWQRGRYELDAIFSPENKPLFQPMIDRMGAAAHTYANVVGFESGTPLDMRKGKVGTGKKR